MTDNIYYATKMMAKDPPGGIPKGWKLVDVNVYGEFYPENGEIWFASAEYKQANSNTGTRRLIGSGKTVVMALIALQERMKEPLSKRIDETKGGWDVQWIAGRVK